MGRAALAALPALLVAILVLPAIAGAVAGAESIPLQADMDHVFWLSDIAQPRPPYWFHASYTDGQWHWDTPQVLPLYYDPTDLPDWLSRVDRIYVVVCYTEYNGPAGPNKFSIVRLFRDWPGAPVIINRPPSLGGLERCVTSSQPVPKYLVLGSDGYLSVGFYPQPPASNDSDILIRITRIGIAPPQGALDSQQQGQQSVDAAGHREPMGFRLDGSSVAVAAAGGFALALLAVLVLGRRR